MKKNKKNKEVDIKIINEIFDNLKKKMIKCIEEKGNKIFLDEYSIYGKIAEETMEFQQEIYKRAEKSRKCEELEDIAVCSVFGIASYKTGGIREKKKK